MFHISQPAVLHPARWLVALAGLFVTTAFAAAPAPDRATALYEIDFMEDMIDHHAMAVQTATLCEQRAVVRAGIEQDVVLLQVQQQTQSEIKRRRDAEEDENRVEHRAHRRGWGHLYEDAQVTPDHPITSC